MAPSQSVGPSIQYIHVGHFVGNQVAFYATLRSWLHCDLKETATWKQLSKQSGILLLCINYSRPSQRLAASQKKTSWPLIIGTLFHNEGCGYFPKRTDLNQYQSQLINVLFFTEIKVWDLDKSWTLLNSCVGSFILLLIWEVYLSPFIIALSAIHHYQKKEEKIPVKVLSLSLFLPFGGK